jgi:hypothetical protein
MVWLTFLSPHELYREELSHLRLSLAMIHL